MEWIDFCKNPIAYDLARSLMFSLIAYSIIGLGGHYILEYDARQSHGWGILFMFLILFMSITILGKKHGWLKDLFKNMDKEVEE